MPSEAQRAPGEDQTPDATPLVEVEDLSKHFRMTRFGRTVSTIRAVDGVSFAIPRGKTLGLVGESGSGKSTTARLLLRIMEPTGGAIRFEGVDLKDRDRKALRALRRRMQIVFQNPLGSLNPRMRVLDIIGEPLEVHRVAQGEAKRRRVVELLDAVGLSSRDLHKYAHEFSGGQAQRIGIARALATSPDLIVADEAVSALDVSVQAQILNLLVRLQRELGLTYLFIGHDLNVVRYISDETCVMYRGTVVERGPSQQVFGNPQHSYTKRLLDAVPSADPARIRGRRGPGRVGGAGATSEGADS